MPASALASEPVRSPDDLAAAVALVIALFGLTATFAYVRLQAREGAN